MTIKLILKSNSLTFKGDGSALAKTFNCLTAPIVWGDPRPSPTFALAQTMPTDAINLDSSDGKAVTASMGLLGNITFTWPTGNPIPNGDKVTVSWDFEF